MYYSFLFVYAFRSRETSSRVASRTIFHDEHKCCYGYCYQLVLVSEGTVYVRTVPKVLLNLILYIHECIIAFCLYMPFGAAKPAAGSQVGTFRYKYQLVAVSIATLVFVIER